MRFDSVMTVSERSSELLELRRDARPTARMELCVRSSVASACRVCVVCRAVGGVSLCLSRSLFFAFLYIFIYIILAKTAAQIDHRLRHSRTALR